MKLCLCSLVLNEMEHLPKLVEQHRHWAGVDALHWVFVEAADAIFAKANPDSVSADGLSVDGTSVFLTDLARSRSPVTYVRHGFSTHTDPAQGKVQARNRYLAVAETIKPDFLLVIDADEFHTHAAQAAIVKTFAAHQHLGYCFRQRHIFRPPSLAAQPLFASEVVGGYWSIPHSRGWRWSPGLRYVSNHNTPEDAHGPLSRDMRFFEYPEAIHLGFASSLASRESKHKYYVARGEGRTDSRGWYVESRACWEHYQPGDALPRGARVVPFRGEVPEVFQ